MLKLFKNLKPYKFGILFIILLTACQAFTQLYLPKLMSNIVDKGIINGDINYILKIGTVMILVALLGSVAAVFSSLFSSKVAIGFSKDLRKNIFTKVETLSVGDFNQIGTASLITRTTNDINQIQQVLVMMLRMMLMAPIMCAGGIVMALTTNAKLSTVLLFAAPWVIVSIAIVSKKATPLFKSMQKKLDKLNLVLRENLTGIRVIRAFNRISHERIRFNEANDDLTNTSIKVNKIMAVMMPLLQLILNLTAVAIIWFGGIRIDQGSMQIGDLMAFIQYTMEIMFSLLLLSMMFVMIPRASASAVRLNEVLEIEPSIKDEYNDKVNTTLRGFVEFKNVSFKYSDSETPVLSNINFSSNPGETTAIIGGTGSGKSTLIGLLPRFYDVTDGEILVSGINIKDIPQHELRNKIGFVPQKAVLFTGTISENIKYGKDDATLDEIKHAAEIAQATDFISEMKDNFETVIDQGGNNVSGGQKQRLSIARAIIRKPEIYIFDDSFSALDFKTDAKLRAALKNETVNSTVLIVAQRVSTVMDADRIIVLDDGIIVGIGTHKELLKTCDVYKEIVSSQLSKEEIENE
ncbi:ABC transporter ATP-binding protein [Clostridium botulinum]|uniref:ABC transporter ATP-binding protein n=1 Tax=Clostridium TaxID=1485 RepID=UPI0013FC2351|nr:MULTISPECIES: ABC transporter ATP-binding protein [Clostridium]MCS6130749.1 ABC transporter ATP-binding protein [Clostridium botulinum]NFL45990.1 ABC transporter ATP-binding protein [Clostridium botulinum]NFL89165.1 ABC transporter ATP-binding protein [Clostridium botulinum]